VGTITARPSPWAKFADPSFVTRPLRSVEPGKHRFGGITESGKKHPFAENASAEIPEVFAIHRRVIELEFADEDNSKQPLGVNRQLKLYGDGVGVRNELHESAGPLD